MPYRIEYGPAIPPQYVRKRSYLRLKTLTALFFLLFSLLVRQYFPAGVQHLKDLLLPDSSVVTQKALDTMMGDLRNGAPLGDAFATFCTYIIDHDETIPR